MCGNDVQNLATIPSQSNSNTQQQSIAIQLMNRRCAVGDVRLWKARFNPMSNSIHHPVGE